MTQERVAWREGFDRSMTVPFTASSVDDARYVLQDLLDRAPLDRISRENAVVVFHELAMNAVDHGRSDDGTFRLGWSLEGDLLRLTVVDDGTTGDIRVRPLDLEDPRGRGLLMVDAFSARWDVQRDGCTRVTAWVELVLDRTAA